MHRLYKRTQRRRSLTSAPVLKSWDPFHEIREFFTGHFLFSGDQRPSRPQSTRIEFKDGLPTEPRPHRR